MQGLRNLPFDTLLELGKLASADTNRLLDLEAGGSLMQSTQYEMDIHKRLFATLLLAKPDLPAEAKKVLGTPPGIDKAYEQRRYNHWLAPLEGPTGECVTCLGEPDLVGIQYFLDHIPPIQQMGEAIDQFGSLQKSVSTSPTVKALAEAAVRNILPNASPVDSAEVEKFNQYATDALNGLLADKAGAVPDTVDACAFVTGVLLRKGLIRTTPVEDSAPSSRSRTCGTF